MESQDKNVVDKSSEWCAVLKYFLALISPIALWIVAKLANGQSCLFKKLPKEKKLEKELNDTTEDKMAPILERLLAMESNIEKVFIYLDSLEKKVSNIEQKVEEAFEKVKSKRREKSAKKDVIESINEKVSNKLKHACNAKETLKSLLDQILDVDKSIKDFKNQLKSRDLTSVDINLLKETLEKVQKFGKSVQDTQKNANYLKIDYNAPLFDKTCLKCPRPFFIVKKTFS